MPSTTRFLVVLSSCLVWFASIALLQALPEIKSDKSLGTWREFVTSLKLQNKPGAAIYFDTDRLVAGEYTGNDPSNYFAKKFRKERRTNVGRIVKQKKGLDIVVYDFDEIYTRTDASVSGVLPHTVYFFGRRPAAIVADGQISNWPLEGFALGIHALNSCDPDDIALRAPAGAGRGGDGRWAKYEREDGREIWAASAPGSGGYGTSGLSGVEYDDRPYRFLPGGRAGAVCYSWSVLRPGSPGGHHISFSGNGAVSFLRGGVGGGAVWLKSGGRLDVDGVDAQGGLARYASFASGSGGHIIMDSPEVPSAGVIRLNGGDGGAGVVEFRGTPGSPKLLYLLGNNTDFNFDKLPVGLPSGVGLDAATKGQGRNPSEEYQIVSRPSPRVPTVTASAPRRNTNARKFSVAASVTGRNVPAAVRYRVRPPGATFFGRWTTASLPPGTEKKKAWHTEVTSGREGLWQVEVVADDAKGGRSTGKVVNVLVDRRKPECFFPLEGAVKPTGQPGGYSIRVLATDYDSAGSGAAASGPARVEYRLKRPDAAFGNRWIRVPVGGKAQHPFWPYIELTVPITLDPAVRGNWEMQVRAVDAAGNVSLADTTTIKQ